MRKWISILMIITMMSVALMASADKLGVEGFVFSDYTDEDLGNMLVALQQEIADRKIEKTAVLPSGIYNVGVDLPIGSYTLAVELEDDEYCQIIITQKLDEPIVEQMPMPNEDMPAQQLVRTEVSVYSDVVRTGDEPIYISLSAGQCLKLSNKARLTIETGIVFE